MVHARSGRRHIYGGNPDRRRRRVDVVANHPPVCARRVVKYLCRCAAVGTALWPLLLIGAAIEGLQPWWAMVLLSAVAVWLANRMARWCENGPF